jgi:hypothetical protein
MPDLLLTLQDTLVADVLRQWRWAYPLVNTAHLVGVALLFGAIAPLDLRLLGLWPTIPLAPLARVLVPVAGIGLALALLTGPVLFLVDPLRYGPLGLFQFKLALISLAVFHVFWVHQSRTWITGLTGQTAPAPRLRWAGLVSLTLWFGVLLCGRLIAYV